MQILENTIATTSRALHMFIWLLHYNMPPHILYTVLFTFLNGPVHFTSMIRPLTDWPRSIFTQHLNCGEQSGCKMFPMNWNPAKCVEIVITTIYHQSCCSILTFSRAPGPTAFCAFRSIECWPCGRCPTPLVIIHLGLQTPGCAYRSKPSVTMSPWEKKINYILNMVS